MDDTDDYKDHVLFANLNYSMVLTDCANINMARFCMSIAYVVMI